MWTDMDFLVGADPGEVLRTAPSPVGEDERRTATVYRSVARRLSRADGVGRAQLLSLEAARFGWVWDLTTSRERGEPLYPSPPDRRPGRHHARRPRRRLTGGDDATVRAWDLHTHTRIRRALRFPYRVHSVTPVDGGALLVGFADELALLPRADLPDAPC